MHLLSATRLDIFKTAHSLNLPKDMTTLELLSPARNLECGIAAIDHGADAVYIGANKFGARASAGNSIDDITTLCEYAHKFGAKVFVTVNTIIYDAELQETIEIVKQLQQAGADAILLQDMGLLSKLRNSGIEIPIHASTQTDNRTIEKVKWLASMGLKRVVLARELSIQEIKDIHHAVPEVELEVFVHGALCVSYSGQCYASQYCFNRSANRGECAQFCRMAFDLIDADGNILEQSRHLLSLRDMAQLDNLQRLADAGAVSFKIEGRLKGVDYVKNITAAYSEKLNEICNRNPNKYQRASMGHCEYTFTPDIRKSFNRGFTTYFADGRQTPLISPDTPKALGEPIGKVKEIRGKSFNVATTAQFNNGDGLCFFTRDKQLIGFRVNKVDCNRLFPLTMPKELKPGTMLYRNHDQAFESLLTKPSATRKVQIAMLLNITESELSLTIKDETQNTFTATLPYAYQQARTPQDDNIRKQLSKTGNTIYTCSDIQVHSLCEQPFIASSMLAELRRTAINGLDKTKHVTVTKTKKSQNITSQETTPPQYRLPYMYNASNNEAIHFYEERDTKAEAFETSNKGNILMQCRYCLKAEMGCCTKRNPGVHLKEPLQLRLSGGKTFTLKFNCKDCEMEVLK